MAAPDWLQAAVAKHGARAVAEAWSSRDWMAIAGIGTAYRAKEIARLLREDVDDRYSPPTLEGLEERLAGWSSERQRRKPSTVVQLEEGDDGRAGHWYEVAEATGDYRFFSPRRATPIVMTKDEVAELVASYVKDGDGVTQQALARQFGRPRRHINAILRALSVTKDSPPIVPEDMAEQDEEELVEEWMAHKAARVERRAHRRTWAAVERDAMRWRELELSTLQYVRKAVEAALGGEAVEVPAPAPGGSYALLLVPTDVHIGKRGWEGFAPNAVDTPDTRRRLLRGVQRVLDLAPGKPEVIYLTIGGDLFHVDNAGGSTSRGTPQDMDTTPEEMVVAGFGLMFQLVRALARFAPVRLVLHGGNHDTMLSLALYAALVEGFSHVDHVEQAGDTEHPFGPYQVIRYGQSLVGFTHGDGRHKVGDLAPLMAQRWPKLWGDTRHRYWLTGHRHHLAVEEARGVEVHTVPSMSGNDRYHARHWPHESRPRLGAYVLDPELGMVAQLWGDIK